MTSTTTAAKMENFHSKVMLGMAVVGGIFQGEWDNVTFVLAGHHDVAIKCFAYHHQFGQAPASEAELDVPSVLLVLERIKGECRAAVQHVLDQEAKDQRDELLAQLRNSNKPHAMGTVDQIAKRFGISKSEVRRRKTEGTLGELMLAPPSSAAPAA